MINRNYSYEFEMKFINSKYSSKNFSSVSASLQNTFNSHTAIPNPKEITSITCTSDNTFKITLWSKYPLPEGREALSLRRLSQSIADINPNVVKYKSHVLVSV